jgi:hypothetical protein
MRRMNVVLAIVLVWVSVMLAGIAPVCAQTAQTAPAPRIFSVVPDLAGTTLVVSGLRFGEGVEVWVDGQLVPVLAGATDERLEIDVPAAWREQPGTYRLVVRTTAGRTDSFEVTLSSAGAWGTSEDGPDGRSVGSPSDGRPARRPGVDATRRAGAAAFGGTRPDIAPSVTEDIGPPYATKVGTGALGSNSGYYNTAAGYHALFSNTTGGSNTAAGTSALLFNTTGSYNIASGYAALYYNTTGYYNTAAGALALYANTTGYNNTAAGTSALYANTTGNNNTAAGYSALYTNTTGISNTAAGAYALQYNTTGSQNTAAGLNALTTNSTGYNNTAAGVSALYANTTGYDNTAAGTNALSANTTGVANTASGYQALFSNTTGYWNTAVGSGALRANATGISNTASGYQALYANTTGYDNTAAGMDALMGNTTGHGNVALGYLAGGAQTTGSDNVYVANGGVDGENGTIRIGTAGTHTDTYLAGTVRATAFVGDGAGLTNVTCAGSGGSSVPPAAPDSQAVVSELQELRRTVAAQALREASQDQLLTTQAQQVKALQQRLAQLEARLAPARTGGSR